MLNKKVLIVVFILLPCLGLTILPICAIASGYFMPSQEHLLRARDRLPVGNILQIGFSSGSVKCDGEKCDYRQSFDQKQYISTGDPAKVVSIKKGYDGLWSISESRFTFASGLSLLALYMIVFAGLTYSVRGLKSA
ncbi:hypothetical protein M5M_18240 [Simiduia agarivorans SA1 = DSM 21679]|uniref:Uncharacterized protein n=1 Tax=Simiduia agarivorans (strain DSM 21679 / JCM 13881 / BCRC 17597 / SA1) TaxID=1117647 RepID=K4KP35_SIMAS|nr:hypothetical protein M5M_18240 [Simiduia agarivorans SA1 = DSM 21679]